MKIHPYLNFENTTEEAFRFYEKVLGGKLTEIHRFGSMPQDGGFELTPEQKNLVMHVGLELSDGQMIMGSDMLPGMGPQRVEGNKLLHLGPPRQPAGGGPHLHRAGGRRYGHHADGGPVLGGLLRQSDGPVRDQLDGELLGQRGALDSRCGMRRRHCPLRGGRPGSVSQRRSE